MTITKKRADFIKDFYKKCKAVCPKYGLEALEAIVAQACIESAYGESTLASKYHNYWGMKCGTSYKGKSVNMSTKEEYTKGTLTTIKDNFRAYDSVKAGIKGYCEFITSMSRYKNLIGVKDDITYIKNIKADGWATSSTYVATVTNMLLIVKAVLSDKATISNGTTTGDAKVKKAQSALNQFIDAKLTVDGVRGKETNKALVKALQYALNRDYGARLVVDGVLGAKTTSAYSEVDLKKGSKSYVVSWLEIALLILGYYNSSIEFAGIFGSGLDSAVKNFQTKNKLTSNGVVKKATIKAIITKLGLN